jgi:hypothetical protein
MHVCEEDTIEVIRQKYKHRYNSNAHNYVWRKKCTTHDDISGLLFTDKTLTQNGILYHENERFGLPFAIWLYYNFE